MLTSVPAAALLLCHMELNAVLIVFGATGAVGHALLQCVMKDTQLGKDIKVRAWSLAFTFC
jgi:hypothetical protein